ncbi:hypothetical protein SK803_26700 [Lentzea sp. BCCO 10_0856]|uniref:Uncharacterized protein n=1 Tax=Lentzea miocenica TaxID=3095431 RepID=A0ABU4T6N3_9PSEU|nr:hypothetical protein [Lentzea sp. BCCO 10_0856]MDX8033827.1 hypothetical protein [Lentzea sp. BCCO 10_0856]
MCIEENVFREHAHGNLAFSAHNRRETGIEEIVRVKCRAVSSCHREHRRVPGAHQIDGLDRTLHVAAVAREAQQCRIRFDYPFGQLSYGESFQPAVHHLNGVAVTSENRG